MTGAGRSVRPGVWAIPLLAIAIVAAAVVPASTGAGAGTPPPSSSPSSQPSPTSVPPVITTPASSGPTELTLVSQPPWVAAESALPLGLRIEGPTAPGMTINVIAHQAVDSRIRYDRALRGEQFPPVAGQVIEIPLEFAPPDVAGLRPLTLDLQTATDQGANRLALRTTDADVFPVEVELRDAEGNKLAGFVTPVVVVAPGPGGTPTIGQQLNVAWVWPMVDRPAFLLDGTADPEVVADLGFDGRIGGQALALDRHDVPVTIAPGPETLEAWQLLAQPENPDIVVTLAALRSSIANAQVLNSPYVPIDIPSLEAGGFEPEIGVELQKGADTLLSGLGVSADQGTAIVDPINNAAVARLRTNGVSEFLVKDTALVPRADNLTPARPFLLPSDPRNITAVASDSGLQQLLEGPDPPALRAQRFLAALSVIAVELPNVQRGVVVLNPADGPPDLDVLNTALAGLAEDHPLLDPGTLDDLFKVPLAVDEATGEQVVRELAPITPADPPVSLEQYRDTERALAGYKSLLTAPTPLSARGDKALLVSLSSAWEGAEGRARAENELAAVTDGIDQFVGGIHVPVNPTITVTASKAEIPVTFLNDTDPPQTVTVRVTLDSDELTFPDGSTRELELPPRNTTFRFSVEARGSGTFPLSLRVTSPDGSLQLQQTEVQVRSTFVSNVGVFLTVGAVLFLALWWGNDFRRRRKRRAAAATPDPGTEAQTPSAAAPGAPR